MLDRTSDKAKVQFPTKAQALFVPAPFKVMHGGRGGSKTWDFCRALLILGIRRKLFILCAREIQKSISESVHRVLAGQIDEMGLWNFYTVQAHRIIGKNGTEIVFAGVRNNITAIKSMEGIDLCAVFEATFVSEYSWSVLLPTIRRDAPHGPFGQGSEIWVEFNPELVGDYSYKYWVLEPPGPVFRFTATTETEARKQLAHIAKAKPRTVVTEINWRDNPWFPDFLKKQKDDLRVRDYESYLTVWQGKVRRILKGAIYAKELERAQTEGRISPNVHVDRSRPVDISADLGRSDTTSLTFWQQIGMEHHAVDYYGNFGFDWSHYLEQIQGRKYIIGKIYLPHDGGQKRLEAPKSIVGQTRAAYPGEGRVIQVPVTKAVADDINAVRTLFPRMYFNEKTCGDLLTALAHYRYEVDEETKEVSINPLHDWASHPADSVRTYVMGLREGTDRKPRPQLHQPTPTPTPDQPGTGWMFN